LYGDQHAPETSDPQRIGYAIAALLPFWGDRPVADVSKSTCREYGKSRNRAPATVRRELGTLNAALRYAVDESLIASAPAVLLPAKPEGKDRWLTRPEAARLLNAARNGRSDVRLYLPLFILLGLYTGARKEAILTLRWPQVDLKAGRINFGKAVTDDGGIRSRKATNKRRAHIPIPNRLLTFLRLAYRRRDSDIGFVVHDKGQPIKDIGGGWADIEDRQPQGSFGRACKRADLPGVTPHTLRHTCGTWMAQGGVDLFKIGGWLGHSDDRTTRLYAHHHPSYQQDARDALDRRKA
jgi:integrase